MSSIQRARKKPVVIQFVVWDESHETLELLVGMGMRWGGYRGHADTPDLCYDLTIKTLEGSMRADKGDIIIKGVKGEFYPCKPDIFERTYDVLPAAEGGEGEPSN